MGFCACLINYKVFSLNEYIISDYDVTLRFKLAQLAPFVDYCL